MNYKISLKTVSAIVLVLLFSLNSGCSTFRMGYRHADVLLVHAVDRYIELDDSQKEQLAGLLQDVQQYHSHYELPKYVEFLQQAKIATAGDFDHDAADHLLQQFNRFMETLTSHLIDAISPVAAELSEEQINKIEQQLAEQKAKREQRLASKDLEESYASEQVKGLTSTYEYWLGDLNNAQTSAIQKTAEALPDTRETQRNYVDTKLQQMFALLHSDAGSEQLSTFMKSWLIDGNDRTVAHQQMAEQEKQLQTELLVSVVNSASDKQKKRLNKKIDKWIKEFTALYPDDLKQTN